MSKRRGLTTSPRQNGIHHLRSNFGMRRDNEHVFPPVFQCQRLQQQQQQQQIGVRWRFSKRDTPSRSINGNRGFGYLCNRGFASGQSETEQPQQRSEYTTKAKTIRPYQRRAHMILKQVQDGTIPQRALIPQMVEHCLESFLQYEHGSASTTGTRRTGVGSKATAVSSILSTSAQSSSATSSLVASDGPLARGLLDAVLNYRHNCNHHIDTIPRVFSLCCQIMVRSGHATSVRQVPDLLEHKLLKNHAMYFARAEGPAKTMRTTRKIDKGLVYNTHHVNDACVAYIHHVVVTNEKSRRRDDDVDDNDTIYNLRNNNKQMQHLQRILKRLEHLYEDPNVPLMADPQISQAIILLLCHQRRPYDAYKKLQWMVDRAKKERAQQNDQKGAALLAGGITTATSWIPSIASFATTISGFAKTGDVDMARQVVQWMLASNKNKDGDPVTSNNVIPPPNRICFNALLHAYVVKGGKDAGLKAEQTIEWMKQLHNTDGFDTMPDEISFNTVIGAYAKAAMPDSPFRAESILKKMISMHEEGLYDAPSEETFTSTMNAWSTCQREDSAARVEALIDLMEALEKDTGLVVRNPDIPYSILIKTWEARARQSNTSLQHKRQCADGILAAVERMNSNGITPGSGTINAVLTALSATSPLNAIMYFLKLEQDFRNGSKSVELNTKTFNSALNAIATLNKPDAMDRATEIFERMTLYSSPYLGKDGVHTTNTSLLPSRATYNIILKILSRSPEPDAAKKADVLLLQMDERSDLSPDFISFLTTILAWGRSESEQKFERITEIIRRYALNCSRRPTSSLSRKDTSVFNAALSVCDHNSNSDVVRVSVSTASYVVSTLRQIKGMMADETTYKSFFNLVGSIYRDGTKLVNDDLDELIRNEFTECIADGLVSRDILINMHHASPQVWEEVVRGAADPETFDIPHSWCRNVNANEGKRTGRSH